MSTLFENEHFIIVDKKPNTLVVSSRIAGKDPRSVLSHNLNALPVHRLDSEVSGIVLFAKSKSAQRVASQWFESRLIQKTYEAWTSTQLNQPMPLKDTQVWTSILMRGKKRAYESPHGKEAITHVRFIKSVKNIYKNLTSIYLQWTIQPRTGRSHQIRFEFFKHGFPIVGDSLYGSSEIFFDNTIALRATSLNFSNCKEAKNLGLTQTISAKSLIEYFN